MAPRPGFERPLSEREANFARHYVTTGNAQDAAIRAGYSPRSAKVAGHRCLQRNTVKAKIRELTAARAIAVNRLIAESAIGQAGRSADDRTTPLELRKDIDADVAAAVASQYLVSAAVENLEIALGRRKTKVIKPGRGKAEPKEIEVYMRDGAAANRAIEVLAKLKGIVPGDPTPPQAGAEDGSMAKSLKAFRAALKAPAPAKKDKPE